jgi:hypothetical protein
MALSPNLLSLRWLAGKPSPANCRGASGGSVPCFHRGIAIGGIGALIVWYLRKSMPESPRWPESKGRTAEAERLMAAIEAEALAGKPRPPGRKRGLIVFLLVAFVIGAFYPFITNDRLLTFVGFLLVSMIYLLVTLNIATYIPGAFPPSTGCAAPTSPIRSAAPSRSPFPI